VFNENKFNSIHKVIHNSQVNVLLIF